MICRSLTLLFIVVASSSATAAVLQERMPANFDIMLRNLVEHPEDFDQHFKENVMSKFNTGHSKTAFFSMLLNYQLNRLILISQNGSSLHREVFNIQTTLTSMFKELKQYLRGVPDHIKGIHDKL